MLSWLKRFKRSIPIDGHCFPGPEENAPICGMGTRKPTAYQTRKTAKTFARYPRFNRSTGVCPLWPRRAQLRALRTPVSNVAIAFGDEDLPAAMVLDEAPAQSWTQDPT
jgi:hypothetical protein